MSKPYKKAVKQTEQILKEIITNFDDLIDEAEKEIGCKIHSVRILPKQGTMLIRDVKFHVEL